MLTQKAKYGLRALEVLATDAPGTPRRNGSGTTMTIGDVAERAGVPHKFLEAILLELRRHGFVESRRGKSGGYALARPAERIGVGDVIRALDGPLAPIPCASLTAYRPCADCTDPGRCAIQNLMRRVRDATAAILDGTTLATLAAADRAETRDDSLAELLTNS